MTDLNPELIEEALREFVKPRMTTNMSLDGLRAKLAAALSAVADDLRAEGAAQAREQEHHAPAVRHRDAITGQYVDADEAAARPETTIRETRKP